ncbi:DUF1302 domain-containing protein [Acidovorax sp. CCYZU-2555]|uniref:DUF1302 domain-containing protein n=1 Tax=Acidovorax sp. CCYZU-2555 TaxID=2835042 RepID=UPI001BCC7736|nr:DUF1302 domain-containing protein [Acidovorax sp. CCYZU-2555]MBS7778485.1 DUF1302 domain-containing protein [Acidovorax sp. CCYZU-2555]
MSTIHSPRRAAPARTLLAAAAALLASGASSAFEFDSGNPDVKIRWDNTLKYSNAFRLKDRSPGLSTTQFGPAGVVGANNQNQDDGNNNFGKGLVSNRADLLSELDITGPNWGGRISAAAWYDTVYNRSTDNPGISANHSPASEFTSDTRSLMGRKAELLDAFVFGKFDLADKPATVRLGRHTLLWGESLFFGVNGIAGGQAPLDLIKLLSVPNSQFKETVRPTGKLSGQVQLSSDVAVGAYWTYEWEKTRLAPVGSYLSASDSMGPGAERINAGPTGTFTRQADLDARDGGQGGLQLRWRVDAIDTDLGFYATRYHATTPSNIWNTLSGAPPALRASSYRWAYHEGVSAFGASFAKTVGEWGLAGEVSLRRNAPLASSGQSVIPAIGVGTRYDNRDNPGYAVGETGHAQFSWLASLGPSFIAREASFLGEIAWNRRLKVTQNAQMLNPNTDRDATALRMVFAPSYRQVMPGLDLTPSVGIGYAWGRSSAVGPGFGVDKGGDFNIGLAGVYLGKWTGSLNYVHYLGKEGPTLDNNNNAQFRQSLKDRNFLSFSLRTTF